MTAGRHVLVARLDNDGDVLLAGPAIRAVAATAGRVTLLCGPRGRRAADALPGVDEVLEHRAAWIDPAAPALDVSATENLVDTVRDAAVDEGLILTSFHQSPLPLALLLRLAGVPTLAAVSDDYPGSLLDVRHRVDADVHEVERSLSLAATLGYRLPAGDDGRLAVRRDPTAGNPMGEGRYVVVHPGASVPARAWAAGRHADLVDELVNAGWRVAVTGGPGEEELTKIVAGPGRDGDVVDLGGATTFGELTEVLAGADAVIVGNTGPAHLAAAVGTPVVSLFAATVPSARWRPWGVPCELLGDETVPCAGCRATACPVPGHPCVGVVAVPDVIGALNRLLADKDRTLPPTVSAR